MATLAQLDARIKAVMASLNTALGGLRGDITNLKAQVEVLRDQLPDPAILADMDAAVASLETTAAALADLDALTPPIPPPGEPA